MAKFYGQVFGQSSTPATRRGSSDIKVSAQSYDGSVQTEMWYRDDELVVRIDISEESSAFGSTYFCGTLDELKRLLKGGKQ